MVLKLLLPEPWIPGTLILQIPINHFETGKFVVQRKRQNWLIFRCHSYNCREYCIDYVIWNSWALLFSRISRAIISCVFIYFNCNLSVQLLGFRTRSPGNRSSPFTRYGVSSSASFILIVYFTVVLWNMNAYADLG